MLFDDKKNVDRLVYGLYALCALLFLADFFYKKKYYISAENFPGFYALYGFFACVVLVLCAKVLRRFLMRDEGFYAPQDTESEDHPDHDLGKESHYD
ncbi:DUF2975 domain-containing protein [Alphaproteobacteria bacterium KMM 3653]|uniref:DUF2975 domain-containing protein n=2 Tax=Harenicola maris TaxID=2841044 RepID=A0AAP2CQI6_9RHOB|nr:DUF2975 domain-containing protein [Harenicola maris]